MTRSSRYGDDRTFDIPPTWQTVSDEVLETALRQSLVTLGGDQAVADLVSYYDRGGPFAGTLFLDAQPNEPFSVEAADLYAVTTLSIELDSRHGRILLDEGDVRANVQRGLRHLDPTLPITDLEHGEGGSAETLQRMYELHARFRDLLGGTSSRWVTAAKLCARKRPTLFPVRDNLVCIYLGAGRPLKSGSGWPGNFSVDLQVYAYLMTHPEVRAGLTWLRAELTGTRGLRLDGEDMRLLDSALWMASRRLDHA